MTSRLQVATHVTAKVQSLRREMINLLKDGRSTALVANGIALWMHASDKRRRHVAANRVQSMNIGGHQREQNEMPEQTHGSLRHCAPRFVIVVLLILRLLCKRVS